MDDGELDGEVRGIVGYSRYPRPPKIRVIRETLETPKQPQELNNNFLLDIISFFNTLFIGLQSLNYGNNN
jgi:hypothetical protein